MYFDAADTRARNGRAEALVELYERAAYVRVQPAIWLVHSAVMLASGDRAEARRWAERALEASRRYDVSTADSIRQAMAAVKAAAG